MDIYLEVLKNYSVSGRAPRNEFWMFTLVNLIVWIILQGIFYLTDGSISFLVLMIVYGLAVVFPSIAVQIRRLHDIGRSGWWLLISLIPYIGAFVLIYFYVLDSEPGTNKFGANPKGISSPEPPLEVPKSPVKEETKQ